MKIAVTIPCRNEEKYIIPCVQSVLNSKTSGLEIEVLVCDGKSTDSTLSLLDKHYALDPRVKILINESQFTPQALNLGIKNTHADFIMILGAHSIISDDYLQKCVAAFALDPTIGCTGGLLVNQHEDLLAANVSFCMSSTFGVGSAHFRTGASSGYVDTVAFGIYRKEVFGKVGLFDEDLVRNQDDEFNYRVVQKGYKIYLLIDTTIQYFVRSSFSKLWNQYLQYGYWKVYVNTKHKTVTSIRQLIPFFWVCYLISTLLVLLLIPMMPLKILSLLPLFSYLLIAFYFSTKKIHALKDMIQRMIIYLILHTSYGWGYLKGIFHFVLLNKKPSNKAGMLTR
jgi:glycosyltransferase involved in cell wall biosynthesis